MYKVRDDSRSKVTLSFTTHETADRIIADNLRNGEMKINPEEITVTETRIVKYRRWLKPNEQPIETYEFGNK
jgi:hypothetical protein